MNAFHLKKQLEKKLIRRGMKKMLGGKTIIPPKRMFETLGEEILWILNESEVKLSVNELSDYLCKDKKTIQKVMRKLTSSKVNLVKKVKNGNEFLYKADFNKDLDIKTFYKVVRMEATQRIR